MLALATPRCCLRPMSHIRWAHFKKKTIEEDFIGNKKVSTVEWHEEKTRWNSPGHSHVQIKPTKLSTTPNKADQLQAQIMLLNSIAQLIGAAVKEWNSNPRLRKAVDQTAITMVEATRRFFIGPPVHVKEQYQRIETFEALKRETLLLPHAFQNGSTHTKIAQALNLKAFPAPAHEILGVGRNATSEEIKAKYHLLAKKWHPDTVTDTADKELHSLIFTEVTIASNHLKKH